MSIRSVSLSFCIVHMCTHHLFLHSHERLIGRHDHTAIIARSPCRVEEAIFWEMVSGGEAQWTLRGTWWRSRRWKKAVLFVPWPFQVHFTQETRAIALSNKSNRLGFERGLKWSYKLMQDCKIYPSRRVIPAKNVFTRHENDYHVLDHMFRLCFVLRFDTVLWSLGRKCNVYFLFTTTVNLAIW